MDRLADSQKRGQLIGLKVMRPVSFLLLLALALISLFLAKTPLAWAASLTYGGVTMSFSYADSLDNGDCANPARGQGFLGDVYVVNSPPATVSVYMAEGPDDSSGLEDPYLEVLDADLDRLQSDDDNGADDNGDGDAYSSFISEEGGVTYVVAGSYDEDGRGSYTLYSSVELTLLTQCPQVITANFSGGTYGTAATVSASTNSGLDVSIASSTPSVCTVGTATFASGSTTAPVAFASTGTCTLSFDQDGDDSNEAATQVVVSRTVSAKTLTGSISGTLEKTFDGSTSIDVSSSDVTLTGVVDGDTVSVADAVGTLDSAKVGSRAFTVASPVLAGTSAANYEFSGSLTGSALVIAPATPSGLSGNDSGAEERADFPAIHLDLQAGVGDSLPGALVVIGGEGLAGASAYTLIVRSTPQVVESGTASALGNFSKSVPMSALAPGTHTLTLTATAPDGSTLTLVQPFTVDANGMITSLSATAGSTSVVLAATGVSTQLMVGGVSGLVLLVLGFVMLMVARGRSSASNELLRG